MKAFFALVFLWSSVTVSAQTFSTKNLKVTCKPVGVSHPSFDFLKLESNHSGEISGRYQSAPYGVLNTSLMSEEGDQWMTVSETVYARKNNKGQIVIRIVFSGRMGGDMDEYTLRINRDGSSTLDLRYQTDCGDGFWHSRAQEHYDCQFRK